MPKRSTTRLSPETFERLRPQLVKQRQLPVEVWDSAQPGLVAHLFPTGTVTLYAGYRSGGKARRYRLGAYLEPVSELLLVKLSENRRKGKPVLGLDVARELVARIKRDALDGIDPRTQERAERARPRVAEYVTTFLGKATSRRKARTVGELERHLTHASEAWRDQRIDLVTADDVRALVAAVQAEAALNPRATRGGEVEAARLLAALSSLFSSAFRDGHVSENVVKRVERPPTPPSRTRVPDDREVEALLAACEALREKDPAGTLALEMLVFTGARLREVLKARWEHFELGEHATWTIPPENAKTGNERRLPLPPRLAERLRATPRTGLYVIAGRSPLKPRADLAGPWRAVLEHAHLEESGLTLHDLRRRAGLDLFVTYGGELTSKVLGHSTTAVTSKVYSPMSAEHMRHALETRGGELLAFRTGGDRKAG